jgi:hypothetical protein
MHREVADFNSKTFLTKGGEDNKMPKLLHVNQTALCYTNTIFSKLLKYQESRKPCIEEKGYELFISILEEKEYKHLYLETLDSIKLFLAKRDYLEHFKQIPECIYLD